MTDALQPRQPILRPRDFLITLAITAAILVVVGAQHSPAQWAAYFASLHVSPHGPDLALLAAQPIAIKLHIAAALSALVIGTVQLLGVKGTALHRVLGWSWVAAMGTTAISSLFIRELNHGSFSFIHLLSGWVIIALPMALWAARTARVRLHGRLMAGLFLGGLIIAGLLTFIPGRLMWRLFLG
ncbi:MAG TPA: DUF2306 domain-containing protein [Caulobacteraceae bacterium]|jgi:uncharacterized membrane protein|nr:DUF2306 domain-containing protein [Caulobacteraceae bacterium]